MKLLPIVTTALALSATLAYAKAPNGTVDGLSARHHRHHATNSDLLGTLLTQAGAPAGRGSTTGDPAASSANPGASPTTGTSKANPSGSGTSTSDGKDDNGDQGRDKMPESSQAVRPDNKPDKM
jgi:ABC-type phosphate transport system substrate-binding protein